MNLWHNSRDLEFRKPFGAAPCGQAIELSLYSDCRLTNAKLIVAFSDHPSQSIGMHLSQEHLEHCRYTAIITSPEEAGLLFYYFKAYSTTSCSYYGNNSRQMGGWGQQYLHSPIPYQITIFQPMQTPSWWKQGIMYQIYTDRFCNGLPGQSLPKLRAGSAMHQSWSEKPYYIRNRDNSIKQWDFFGGNLLGIINKLPILAERGITVIYLNPIFDAVSNHKYDTGDYSKIDPMYGDEAIFKQLVEAVKRHDMHLLLDGVFSHTGADSLYFNQYGHYPSLGAYQSKASPFYSWYRFKRYPDEYACWWGITDLPEVNELDASFLSYMVTGENSIVRKWMRLGIDGWRLDVADELPDAFIKALRNVVLEENEEAVLLGEVWEDASNKISYGARRGFLLGQELNSVTNYPLRTKLMHFILGDTSGGALAEALMCLKENYPVEAFASLMNMTGSHDTVRLLTSLGEAPPADTVNDAFKQNFSLSESMLSLAVNRLKLYALIQFTLPGIPCIYYGDEAGVQGYTDPYNRGTYPWGSENKVLIDWFSALARLRRGIRGIEALNYMAYSNDDDLFANFLLSETEAVIGLVNRSHTSSKCFRWNSRHEILSVAPLLEKTEGITADHHELAVTAAPLTGIAILLRFKSS